MDRTPITTDAFPPVTVEQWRAAVDADLKGAPFERKLVTHTYEGLYVRPLYTAADLPPNPDAAGFSGLPPMTRGGSPLNSSQTGWDIRQERAEPSPEDLNAALLDDLAHGVTSTNIRFDSAARLGLDPDDPAAGPLVGTDGVSIARLDDLKRAFAGVHLGMIHVGLEAGGAFMPAAATLAALWDDAALPPDRARGAFNADPLAVLARDGALPMTLDESLAQMSELAAWTSSRYPHVTAVRVGTAAYHHAGATAAQDLAFALATGVDYLRAMDARGLSVSRAAGQMLFSLSVGCSMFLAIAKLRAARLLWARVVRASGGDGAAQRMRMHVRTSKRVLTTRDPWVNLLRNTVCAFAAGVAGADAVGVAPMDAALGLPSELARRLARNTHLILQDECHLHRVSDPAGGSYYLETLTTQLAERAWVIFQAIEGRGGMAACLQSGFIHEQIDSAVQPRLKNLATRRDAITGVSEFADPAERPLPRPTFDLAMIRQRARTTATAAKTGAALSAAKAALAQAWAASAATSPSTSTDRAAALFAAARAGATIGQMSAALSPRGETRLATPIAPHPFAEPFERLRAAADDLAAATGARPSVFLASIGPIAAHVARTTYAANFFQAGGFTVFSSDGYASASDAANAFQSSGAGVAVICAGDDAYPTLVPELAPALHAAGARTVILAGNPGDREPEYLAAGVDRFIFIKCDVVAILSELLAEEGAVA